MPFIQDWIHRVEEGGGLRYLKYALILFAFVAIVIGYNARGFKNLSTLEAMDNAQLARNIAEHKGYKTSFIRPFSIFMLERTATEKFGLAPIGDQTDRGHVRGLHPDISNPPVYPIMLAGLMKALPFKYPIGAPKSIWNRGGAFWMYQPDFLISVFNQVLLMIAVVIVFFLARSLFDNSVAWASAGIFLATDVFWRFSISGLSTMLIVLIFLVLAWCLVVLERRAREGKASQPILIVLTAVIGVLIGLGALTRYSFGWLILPVLFFLILFLGQHRVILCLTLLATFAVVMAPWMLRNYHLTHTPFGTAQYAIFETTSPFTEHRLQRSLNPDLSQIHYDQVWYKFVNNSRAILMEDLPRLGGNWLNAFFVVGLLIGFKNQSLSRLRYFLLLCLPVLIAVQALGRTQLTDDSPVINSENLLILLAPLVIVFGVSLFFILLDQIALPFRELRYLVIGVFIAIVSLPMLLTFFTPRVNAVAYPPYYPPVIQKTANWMREDELMMSDIPWAVAWYGNRQCMWLTLTAQQDFFAVNDFMRPIKAVYLTPQTLDSRFLSQWVRGGELSWGSFVIDSMLKKDLPPYFPLKKSPSGFLPEQLFLTDRDRWSELAGP
ncbi:MAG: hypothetical protein JWQ71_601 [Pedosphaera sp.]|nr:hypothetical protein [Pedosphaera sp.]